MLYYTEKILGLKTEKFLNWQEFALFVLKILIFKANNANSYHFGELERGCLAWLLRMTFHPIFPGKTIFHGHIPAAFILHAYEGDSPLNHMLTWYKVISVIGQSKFEV